MYRSIFCLCLKKIIKEAKIETKITLLPWLESIVVRGRVKVAVSEAKETIFCQAKKRANTRSAINSESGDKNRNTPAVVATPFPAGSFLGIEIVCPKMEASPAKAVKFGSPLVIK